MTTNVERPGKPNLLDLLAEIESNRQAARAVAAEEMTALPTRAWDGSQRAVRTLPPDLQDDLERIYADINALNQLVWLSAEFQPAGPALRARYLSLRQGIAGRLDDMVRSPRF
jgi:hypothetical protein